MSTRSRIALALPGGNFRSVYCHSDGDPHWNGRILLEHYGDHHKVEGLMGLGHLSSLGPDLGERHPFEDWEGGACTAYGRDRGEEGTGADEHDGFAELARAAEESDAEWLYLWLDECWLFCPVCPGIPIRLDEMVRLTAEAVDADRGVGGAEAPPFLA